MKILPISLAALALGLAQPVMAQSLPEPASPAPAIPAPADTAYPGGTIALKVDATDTDRRIFRVHETIPVAGPGPMVLLYPKWLPGNHSPTGAIDQLGGLIITANGQRIEWRRDPVEVYGFHVEVPAGVKSLDVEFQFLSPTDGREEGRQVLSPDMLDLQWNTVVLYPAGYFSRDITFAPTIVLPEGWSYGTALEAAGAAQGAPQAGGAVTFKPVGLNNLVDSPLLAGRYFKRVDLDPGASVPVHMDIAADRPEDLEIKPEQLEAHRALVRQAARLYGSHHYDHYDFLLGLSDEVSGEGLEHHQSSEDVTIPGYFTDWDKDAPEKDLLPHEYTHSWDGKFRRPADLWTPNFNVPMRDSLLWVYEGQTQYWGHVLAARSGLVSQKETLDEWANVAATYDGQAGRQWKALEDTTNDPITAMRRPASWRSWQRSEDYYSEGALIWLDADTLIREMSHEKKSLDDFAKGFFGVENGSYVTKTYTFDDVVAALNAVQPYDWASFLHTRLDGHGPGAPLDGIKRGGYRLVYTDVQNAWEKQAEGLRKSTDLRWSIGLVLGRDGRIGDVHWDGPAFKAGLTVGGQVIAVNGRAYEADLLKDAITAAKGQGPAVELLVKTGDFYRTVRIDWHGGLRYPHLERDGTGPAPLDAILTPKA
jgi:predicted metalloprotease with PDZ domain